MTETTTVKGKGLAIAGMVLGIVAFILSFFTLGVTLGVVGLVLSAIGFMQLNKSNGPKGMAITGIVLSALAIVLSFVLLSYYSSKLEEGLEGFGDDFKNQLENVDWEAEMNDALNDVEDEDSH